MTNTTTTATYTKLRSGEWGIRATVALRAGQSITVAKRDGSTKIETVKAIVWAGNGVTLAAIGASQSSSRATRSTVASRRERAGVCVGCGYSIQSWMTGGFCHDCE